MRLTRSRRHSHHLWLLTLDDKLFLAPIQNPKRALDVGTGAGLWAVYGKLTRVAWGEP
jgi:16S rRNA G527 N7-methylase RsmG